MNFDVFLDATVHFKGKRAPPVKNKQIFSLRLNGGQAPGQNRFFWKFYVFLDATVHFKGKRASPRALQRATGRENGFPQWKNVIFSLRSNGGQAPGKN